MVTIEKKTRILSVLSIIETGSPDGNYADVSIYADGEPDTTGKPTKQITYGVHQTTEQGSLNGLIDLYIKKQGVFSKELASFLPKIGKESLVDNQVFIDLLKKSALEDPIMKAAQDAFFDKEYYQPALSFFTENDFTYPLSMLVIYDSFIHSHQIRWDLRNKFAEAVPAKGGNEKVWIKSYTETRHEWLAHHPKQILHKTTYRTAGFLKQIEEDNWDLPERVLMNGTLSRGGLDG